MVICRTCLTTPADKDIFELEKDINDGNRNYIEIMLFCLDIKVTCKSPITKNLCHNCYGKIITFYKFKELCLKNDAYLKSLGSESTDCDIKNENCTDSDNFDSNCDEAEIVLKQELDVKEEDTLSNLQLDVKREHVKCKNNTEETKENAINPKKRGRLKKTKSVPEKKRREVCEECGKSFRDLKAHMLTHLPKSERRKLPCKQCSKTFNSYSARYMHHQIKHLGIKKKCDICKKEVICLKQHKLMVHNTAELPHKCAFCPKRFYAPSALADHEAMHTNKTPHQCDQCERKYRTKASLLLHKRRIHDEERSYLCQFCSKTFFLKDKLILHLRSHTKEKPYECTTCGKFFSSSTILKNHQQTHSGEKPHRCEVCSMTFGKQRYLKVHMLKHTRARPHACKYCGVGFGRADHRKRHEFTAHEKHIILT